MTHGQEIVLLNSMESDTRQIRDILCPPWKRPVDDPRYPFWISIVAGALEGQTTVSTAFVSLYYFITEFYVCDTSIRDSSNLWFLISVPVINFWPLFFPSSATFSVSHVARVTESKPWQNQSSTKSFSGFARLNAVFSNRTYSVTADRFAFLSTFWVNFLFLFFIFF